MKKNFNYDLAQKRVMLMIAAVKLLHEVIELYPLLGVVINYLRMAWSRNRAGCINSRLSPVGGFLFRPLLK
ncbi:hypothetical protein D3C85_1813050 [compost metagenome]